jgi:hemerythrin-like domain-containing protein
MNTTSRRKFIAGIGFAGIGLLEGACAMKEARDEVSAVEDLMREHGILRRALLVYEEVASKLRENPASAVADAIHRTATLFRTFGEDYHEKKLEEAYIFPVLKKGGAATRTLVDTLIKQHERGRQITDYILAITRQGKIELNKGVEMAPILKSFALMYQNHAAREDTIIFPEWKQAITSMELEAMGDKFEDIEHEQFGEDGFEKAVRRIAEIETALGLEDMGQFTAQLPTKP